MGKRKKEDPLGGYTKEEALGILYAQYKKDNGQTVREAIDSYKPLIKKAKSLGADIARRFEASLQLLDRAQEIGYPSPCTAATVGFTHPEQVNIFDFFFIPPVFGTTKYSAQEVARKAGQKIQIWSIDDLNIEEEESLVGSIAKSKAVWVTSADVNDNAGHVFGLIPTRRNVMRVMDTSLQYSPLEAVTPKGIVRDIKSRLDQKKGKTMFEVIIFTEGTWLPKI